MQLVWDVTYPDTLAPSYLHLTSKVAGKAAEKAEKNMIQKYQERSHKYIVIPVAVETMGAWFKPQVCSRFILERECYRSLAYLVYGVGGRSHPLEGALVRLICY